MFAPTFKAHDPWEIPKTLGGLAIDYLRWLILVPMVFSWLFLLAFVLIMIGILFEAEINDLIYQIEIWAQAREDTDALEARAQAAVDALIGLGWAGVKTWVFRIWAGAALLAYLVGLLRAAVFGPWQPMGLRRKLFLLTLPLAATAGLLLLGALIASGGGPNLEMVLAFIFAPTLVWLLSAGCLSLSHVLNRVRESLLEPAHPAIQG